MDEEGRKERRGGGAGSKNSRGFTAAEAVISVVVLAILAAYATPKLFGVKEQADATEETLKIKDIEARHSQEMLKAGKRGSNPILGDVVGFRPEVVAEPAPDRAPVLVDYSFGFYSESTSAPSEEGGWLDISPGLVRNAYDTIPGDTQLLCDGKQVWSFFKGKNDPTFIYSGLRARSFEASIVSGGPSSGAQLSDEVPKCRAIYTSSKTKVTPLYSAPTGATLLALRTRPGHVEWTTSTHFYHYSDLDPRIDWTLLEAIDYPSGGKRVMDIPPERYRATCSPHVQRYGSPYILRGLVSAGANVSIPIDQGGTGSANMTGDNGKEKSHWWKVSRANLRIVQDTPLVRAIDGVSPSFALSAAYCERVGPAPEAPPSDPGDPGSYPMAADHSGYCLSPGRKLPTYRDGDGTPTGSSSDQVMELGTEAVDDPTNCP